MTLLTHFNHALQTRALLYMTALSNSLLEAVATAEDAVMQVIALHHSASPSPEAVGPAAKQAGAATGFVSSQSPPADQSGEGGRVLVCSTGEQLVCQEEGADVVLRQVCCQQGRMLIMVAAVSWENYAWYWAL